MKALPVASWINLYQNATLIMGFDFLHVDKNWAGPPSASGSYGTKDFEIFKIFYRLNYLDFYFV